MVNFTYNPIPKPSHKRSKPTLAQRGFINHNTRKKLLQRSGGFCERCGKGGVPLEAAHTVRRWKLEERTTVDLLAHLCIDCHRWADNTAPGRHWLVEFRNNLQGAISHGRVVQ